MTYEKVRLLFSHSSEHTDLCAKQRKHAKIISKAAVNIIEEQMENPEKFKPDYVDDIDWFKKNLKQEYDAYIDTYALLLFKLNKADSAYYYQNIAVQNSADPGSFERFAAYAEKAKGPEVARQFIEGKLANGVVTTHMQEQLRDIYKQLNLSDEDFDKEIAKARAARTEKLKAELKRRMKSETAKSFTLNDLQGKTVTLASYKGKVVIVDFWATWCGPCRASFPGMQKAIEKFKDDNDVVFLFVDTWEDKELKDMQTDAKKFIDDNNYTFNVLLDHEGKTVSDYKVRGIPTTFVINPKGEIQFMDVGSRERDTLVEEISLMIELAKERKI